jgi:hypothetical protein
MSEPHQLFENVDLWMYDYILKKNNIVEAIFFDFIMKLRNLYDLEFTFRVLLVFRYNMFLANKSLSIKCIFNCLSLNKNCL